jgi:hypothetical protein
MPRRGSVWVVPAAAVLALALAGCGKLETNATPWTTPGFAPLEPADPAALPPDPVAEALGNVVTGRSTTPAPHNWAHARGYVLAPIAKVFEALKDPEASRITTSIEQYSVNYDNGEDYPIHFDIHYAETAFGQKVRWDLRYRGGVTANAQDGSPAEVVLEYRRISGAAALPLESGSIVATPVDANTTAVELVCWLEATTTNQATVAGTVRDWFGQLTAVTAALP